MRAWRMRSAWGGMKLSSAPKGCSGSWARTGSAAGGSAASTTRGCAGSRRTVSAMITGAGAGSGWRAGALSNIWAGLAMVRKDGAAVEDCAFSRASAFSFSATSAMRLSIADMSCWAGLPIWSMPVATTDTRITPSIDSSKVAPTMMLASSSTCSRISVAAWSTS